MPQPFDAEGSHPSTPPVDITPLHEGRFVPFRRLGMGSQGETFEAVDRATGKVVALKRFDVHGASSWKDVELAEREARVLQSIMHPALPSYVAHFEHGGALYLAMEKIEGEDLARSVARGVRFTFEDLFHLVATLADVFAHLHSRIPPIVHRDVKPSNLIRRPDGRFVLIDFGSVRDGLRPQDGSTVVGTFGYMAPEQFQGRAMPATDLYGAGATIMTLLTGVTPDQLPHRGLEIDVRAALPASTPEPWLTLLERLTSADPDKRAVDLNSHLATLQNVSVPPNGAAGGRRSSEPFGAAAREDPGREPPSARSEWRTASRSVEWQNGDFLRLPFPVVFLLHLLRVGIFLVLQVILPLLLTLLSIPFGRGLRRTASDISRSGQYADRQLAQLLARVPARSRTVTQRDASHAAWSRVPIGMPEAHDGVGAKAPTRKRRVSAEYVDGEVPHEPAAPESTSARRTGKV